MLLESTAQKTLFNIYRRTFFIQRRRLPFLASHGGSRQIGTTIHSEEVEKFNKLSKQWWDPSSSMMPLREMNSLRVPLIKDTLLQNSTIECKSKAMPLLSQRILDIGCGGGYLSEALARLGASVTGIDPAEESIGVAKHHSLLDSKLKGKVEYRCMTIEELAESERESFDAVIASEVIEHVAHREQFIKCATNVLKPDGHFFVTTINRTARSLLFAKFAAEYILNLVPKGAHDWEMFVTTEELFQLLYENGFQNIEFRGMSYNPLTRKWIWTNNTSVNYACACQKME